MGIKMFKGSPTLFLLFLFLMLVGLSQAAILSVCPVGCDYSNIQTAIDAANSGDSVEIFSGVYGEKIALNKNVTLHGVDAGSGWPIIDAIFLCNHSDYAVSGIGSIALLMGCPSPDISISNNMVEGRILSSSINPLIYGASEQTKVVQAYEIMARIDENKTLEYDDCLVAGYLDLYNKKINRIAHFNNTIFQGKADFSDTIFVSDAYFKGSRFNGDAVFVGSKFNGIADFMGSRFNGTDGHRDSYFWSTKFNGHVNFRDSKFSGTADFWNSEFNGTADFTNSKFNDAKFLNSRFNGDAVFENSDINGTADFENSLFEGGSVRFKGSRFNKIADFRNSELNNAFFGGSEFNGDALFIDSKFNYAEFLDSKFNGDAYFLSNFGGDAYFRSQFHKDAYFGLWNTPSSFEIAGPSPPLELMGREFRGVAYFSGSKFKGNASFRGIHFEKDAYFTGSEFYDIADFNSSEFKGDAYFGNAKFFRALDLTRVKFAHLFAYWSDIKSLVCNDGPTYLALIKNFRDMEQYDASDDIYFQYMDWGQKQRHWYDGRKYLDMLASLSCGYGVKPWNTVVFSIFIFLMFIAFYYFSVFEMSFHGAFWISMLALLSLPKELSPIEDKTYKKFMESKIKGLYLIRYLYISERLIGWALLVLFINTLSRVMIRY